DWPGLILRRSLFFVLLAAVCLLNPAHAGAFTHWPMSLFDSFTAGSASSAIRFSFDWAYIDNFRGAALAYFTLLTLLLLSWLALVLLSFLLNQSRWSWQR